MNKRAHQVAALPWRIGEQGLEILLVTTRTTKRWVIPKGWTMDGKADHEAAAIEAYEEAGVTGTTNAAPAGTYGYLKTLRNGKTRFLNVRVFALQVEDVLVDWPERADRERKWVSKQQAVDMIGEPELLPVVAAFEGHMTAMPVGSGRRGGILGTLLRWWKERNK